MFLEDYIEIREFVINDLGNLEIVLNELDEVCKNEI